MIRWMILGPTLLFVASCGTNSLFQQFEKDPSNLDQVALALEARQPQKALAILLDMVPQTAKEILAAENPDFSNYAVDLANSMTTVADGQLILSLYATAEAAVAGVDTFYFVTELAIIDAKKKSGTALLLDQADDNEALGTFYPAMPQLCYSDSATVMRRLDKSIYIILATGILRGFNPDDVATKEAELRAAVSQSNMLNAAVYSLVNFTCPIMAADTDRDTLITEAEATALTDATCEDIYTRVGVSIDSVAAMVATNPGDANLAKALSRMQSYKTKIDELDSALSTANKIRAFLVAQSNTRS